jgi:glycosyltransferase involved in cell wall biosynthesis
MPIRIMFLNTRDDYGADVAVHVTLMKHFSADDVEIFVLSNSEASNAAEMRERFAQIPSVKATFLPLGRPAEAVADEGTIAKVLAYVPSAASLVRAAAFVRRNRIQVIHATDRPRDASYVSVLAKMTGTISVVHMHSNAGRHLTRPTLWGMRQATSIFSVSNFIRDGLIDLGLGSQKISTIHNAVDADYFNPDMDAKFRRPIRQQYGIPEAAPLVGIAARMTYWKGQRELLGAVSQLRDLYQDLHVLILGADEPEYRLALESMARDGGIAERVHFAGFQQDLRPFLHEIDIFVHPSYWEPFGLAIVEAMAMRKPVIACNAGGVPEIITDGKDGALVEPKSSEAVATALTVLLRDPELRRRMGEAARATVRARFLPRHQCAHVAQHYAKLLAAA